jgi:hypothetical protein
MMKTLPEGTAAAFNEWQRRYIEEPERFMTEWACIKKTLAERVDGLVPTYGERCVAYLDNILNEL